MLQFPYGVYPDGQSLDGKMQNDFSCIISGTICTAYQVYIYDNNSNKNIYTGNKTSVAKYNQEVLTMSIPINSFTNGNNLIWNMRLWTNTFDMLIATNNVIGLQNSDSILVEAYSTSRIKAGQKIQIGNNNYMISNYTINENNYGVITVTTQISGVNIGDEFKIYSDFIDTPSYFFKSKGLPQVTIVDMPNEILSRKYSFTGNYNQTENTPLQYYIFNLYDINDNLIDTTDKVYSANIKYDFDGFLNGETYKLELICTNQDNIEISTGMQTFLVNYFQPNVDLGIGHQVLENQDAIRLILEPDKTSIPKFNGKYSIIQNFPFEGTNSAEIMNDSLVYDNISENPLNIDSDSYTVFMSTRLNNGFEGKVISLSNETEERSIELVGYTFYDNKNGVSTKIKQIYNDDKFVLQSSQEDDVGYIWDNSATWDDSKFWWFPKENLDSKQIKITILPTSSEVMEV